MFQCAFSASFCLKVQWKGYMWNLLELQYCEKLTGNFFITVPNTALPNLVSVIGLVTLPLVPQSVCYDYTSILGPSDSSLPYSSDVPFPGCKFSLNLASQFRGCFIVLGMFHLLKSWAF